MATQLSANDLLAGASTTHHVRVPATVLHPDGRGNGKGGAKPEEGLSGEVELRPLTVLDIQRVVKAAKERRMLTSVLMVQKALVHPKLTVEQVGELTAGLVQFLLGKVNELSGLSLDDNDLEQAVKEPLARACFVLSREFGWTPAECSELTVGQVLVYLEMLARGATEEAGP